MSCLGRLQVGVCMSLCLFSGLLHAADRYWVAGSAGDWSFPANWSTASGGAGGASVPGASDRAVFDGNGLGDCNQNVTINVRGILIQAGYGGTLRQGAGLTMTLGSQNFTQAGGAFAGLDGAITLNGSFTLSGGTFTSTIGTLRVSSSFTHTAGGTFAHNGGTVLFSGGNTTANVNVSETFHNLTLAKNHNAVLTVATGDILVAEGLFIHANGQLKGGLEARGNVMVEANADGGTGTLYFLVPGDQNLVAGGGATAALNEDKPSGTLDLGIGNLSIHALVLAGGGTFRATTGELTVRGAWTHTSGGTFVHNGGTVRFMGANATANVNVTENFNHLTVAKNHNATLTVSSGDTLIVEGLLTHSDGLLSGTIEPRQNVVVGAAADGGTGTLSFKVAGDQELAGNGGKTAGLSLNKPSGTLDLGTSDLAVNAVTLAGAGAFKSTSGILTVRAGWTHTVATSLFDPNGGTVLFSGSSSTANVNVNESFWKLTVAKNHNATLTVASGDTLLVLDALALSDGKANGQLEARASVTIGPLFDGGTAKLAFTGSNPQTYLDQGGNEPDGLITVNKPAAVLVLASNLEATGTGQGVTVSAGTLDLAGFNLSVTGALSVGAAGTLRLQGGETVARGSLSLAAGSTVAYAGAGTYASLPLGNAYHHLTLEGPGTFRHAGAMDVNGNLSILQGTFESAGQDIALAGNWSNAGIYTSGTNTVTLDGAYQALSGDTVFHNLSKQTAVPATLTFASGSAQTVAGALTLKGASGALLALRSGVSGTRWAIEALGTPALLYLDVRDSENLGAEPLDATSTSLDSGNNLNWLFSGLAWSGNGSDNLWTNPANWFGGVVPGLGDTARFGAMGLKSCTVNTNVDLRELRVASGYSGTITQGAGLSFTVREFANEGTFVLGAGGRLVLTGTGTPLSGSGVVNTAANAPNTIVYAGEEEIELPAAPLVPAYHHLELAPPAGFSRYDVLRGTGGAFDFDSLALDTANGYAYLATSLSNPNRVVKVRLSDFTQVGALNLNAGETKPAASFIHQGHLYIALRMSPGRIAKIRLSDFTRVGTLTFPSGENNPISAVLDAPGGHAYFGLRTSPGRIVKVRLSDFARVGALTLASGENELVAAAADLGAGYAYFGTYASPGKVIKLRLSDFSIASKLTLPAGEEYLHAAIADPARDALYWGTSTAPGRIVKVRLSDFARESALVLEPGEDRVHSAVFDPVANKGYFGTDTNTGILVQVDLGTMSRVDAFEMGPNEFNAFLSAAADLEAGYAYFTTEAWVATLVKVNLFKREAVWEQAGPLDVKGDLAIGAGKLHAHSHDLSVAGNWANAGSYASGTNTVRLDGGNQMLGGDNAFHNLVKQVTQPSVLTFESGKTQAVSGTLDLQGAAGNLLSLRASVPGQAWRLDACRTQAIRYTDVKDTDASRGHAVYALSSVNAGNNLNVIFSAPAQVAITTPAESATSPAWVEGTVSGDVTSVKLKANGGAEFDAVRLRGTTWFADNNRSAGVSPALGIVLSPSAPIHLEVTARNDFGEANAVSQDLTWAATDLAGQTFSEDSVTIRQGDSLLLTATGTGSALSVDADGDGTYEYAGVPGQRFAHRYDAPGVYTAWAKIDGVEVGSLSVVVLYADLSKPIACEVAYRREKDVVITPAAHASQVAFGVNDPLLLETSLKGLFNTVDGQGMTIYLRALKRGAPVVTARIGGASGPLLAYKEIDEFTRDLPALWSVMLNDSTDSGATTLTLRPYIPNLRWQFTMFAGTSTFAGGATSVSVNTSDLDPITGEPRFKQIYDPETGETVGQYRLEIEVPDAETKYCFWIQAHQSSSAEKTVSGKEGVNGGPCKVRIDDLIMGLGIADLKVEVTRKGDGGKHEIKLSDPAGVEWVGLTPSVDCRTGKVEFGTSLKGLKSGRYHVSIGDEAKWENVITVVEIKSLSVAGASKVGGQATYVTGKAAAGKVEVTAVIDPPLSASDLPAGFIKWTGGTAGADALHREVTKADSAITDVKATTSYSGPSVEIAVVELASLFVKGASQVGATNNYVTPIQTTGNVEIEAKFTPYFSHSASDLPADLIVWTGGAAGANILERTVTKTVARLTPVTAACGESTSGVNIKVVEVAGLTVTGAAQQPGTTTFVTPQPVAGKVVLTATLNPPLSLAELPLARLSWTGGVKGSDDLHREVLKTVPGTTDVTVTCGSGNRTARIIVWNVQHATVQPAPDGTANTRETIGVCEDVTFSSQAAVTWTVAGGGTFTPPIGARMATTFNAPDTGASCVISATDVGGATLTAALTVIAPTNTLANKTSNLAVFPAGTAGAGMRARFRLQPLSVSFGNLETLEIPGPASNITGYFVGRAGPHAPSTAWTRVGVDNWEVDLDTASSGTLPGPWSDGSYDWVIPTNYRRRGAAGGGRLIVNVTQHFTIEANGTAGVTKAGASCSRHPVTGYAP